MLRRTAFAALFALLAALPAQAQDKTVTVFAAASMKNAIDDINTAFTKAAGIKAVASLAASSALAKQIEQGAPADVFASADLEWMDYVAGKKLIKDDTRVNLLGNKLVLVAPADSKLGNVAIGQGFDIARLAGDGRIAVADVRAVPAGKYAKAALEKLGAWNAAEKSWPWPRTCARRWRWSGAARRRSASSMRPTPRSRTTSRSSGIFRRIRIRRSPIRWR